MCFNELIVPSWSNLSDEEYAEILRLLAVYEREARLAGGGTAYLAGCIMAGAALEALLVAMVHLCAEELQPEFIPRRRGEPRQLLDWSLADLVKASRDAGWLPAGLQLDKEWSDRRARIGDHAEVLRQLRNLVHPSRYVQDHASSPVTEKFLSASLQIPDEARSQLQAKLHEAMRKAEEGAMGSGHGART